MGMITGNKICFIVGFSPDGFLQFPGCSCVFTDVHMYMMNTGLISQHRLSSVGEDEAAKLVKSGLARLRLAAGEILDVLLHSNIIKLDF